MGTESIGDAYDMDADRERLLPLVSRCELVDTPRGDCGEPDFSYEGCRYTFATLVFRRTG